MMETSGAVEVSPFFGAVALRLTPESGATAFLSADDAMALRKALLKAARAAGYVKPGKAATDA